MNTQYVKTKLIGIFGEKPVAFIQALRFVYLHFAEHVMDPEVALIPKLLQDGDTAIDVGANGANWTYWLHKSVGRKGIVYAFEADPYYAIATNLAIKFMHLKNIRLFPFGLSDVSERIALRVEDADGSRLIGKSRVDRSAKIDDTAIRYVDLRRLDSMIHDHPRLAFTRLIKCDVEGYELFVFRGATEILERARPVVIMETGNFELQGYSTSDVYDFFHQRSYDCFALTGDSTLSRTNTSLDHEKAISVNRILLPREKLDSIRKVIRISE